MMKDMVRTFRTTQCPAIFSSTLISSLLFIPAFYIHTNEEGVLIKLNFWGVMQILQLIYSEMLSHIHLLPFVLLGIKNYTHPNPEQYKGE
ncbi:hypothetical protein M2130_002078 [Polynucleobacter sphagniphilus]|nr:hypothetical protein [Polynucleobacter sphagniphilus]